MTPKTTLNRLNDTKAYLAQHVAHDQSTEVNQILTLMPNTDPVSNALSIGDVSPFHSDGRRAKRAAMLVAYLFIEDAALRDAEVTRIRNLSDGAEAPLIAEIRSWFTIPHVNGDTVALHAKANVARMPKWNNQTMNFRNIVRGVYDHYPFNCFNGCVYWAFQAGAISKRYLFNKMGDRNGDVFFPIYSRIGWHELIRFNDDGSVQHDEFQGGEIVVDAGRTVYFETPAKVFGHVACSLGDGRVISQNALNAMHPNAMITNDAQLRGELDKMSQGTTHIISVREMVTRYFNRDNGYRSVQVTTGCFWEAIPAAER